MPWFGLMHMCCTTCICMQIVSAPLCVYCKAKPLQNIYGKTCIMHLKSICLCWILSVSQVKAGRKLQKGKCLYNKLIYAKKKPYKHVSALRTCFRRMMAALTAFQTSPHDSYIYCPQLFHVNALTENAWDVQYSERYSILQRTTTYYSALQDKKTGSKAYWEPLGVYLWHLAHEEDGIGAPMTSR